MWHGSSVPKEVFLALALLDLVAGAFALRVAWESLPEAEAQGQIQPPGPIQVPGEIRYRERSNDQDRNSKPANS